MVGFDAWWFQVYDSGLIADAAAMKGPESKTDHEDFTIVV